MSAAEWIPRPYVVGEENVFVVGMQGIVEEITSETLTIGGVTLPKRMDRERGVRYLSMVWPEAPCEREHCTSMCDPEPSEAESDLDDLVAAIVREHDAGHSSAMPFCESPLCRRVNDMGVLV